MKVIEDKIKALQLFQDTAEERVITISRSFEAEIIDMNTGQLEDGETNQGQGITPGYRPLTVSIKRQKGQPTNQVTLKDEGDFHRSFFVNYGRLYFALGANDEKAEKLERKYGKDIYGLTNDNQDELAEMIKPELIESFAKTVT